MFRIVKFELYKIIKNKFLIIAAVVFLAVALFSNIYYAVSDNNHYGNLNEYYTEYFKGNEGEVSLAEYQKSQVELENYYKGNNLDSDIYKASRKYYYYYNVNFRYDDNAQFQTELSSTKESQKNILKIYGKDSYQYRAAKLNYDMMSKQQKPQVIFALPWAYTANISASVLIAAILIILGVSPAISGEYYKKTDSLILTSKKGRLTAVAAKILATMSFAAITALIFIAEHSLVSIAFYGVVGYNAPMQYVGFESSSCCYNFTVLQYFFIKILIAVFGCIALSLLTLFLSSIFKRQMIPFFIAMIVLGVPFILERFIVISNLPDILYYIRKFITEFSYLKIINTDQLFASFVTYNVFSYPLLYPIAALLLFLILSVVFIILTQRIYIKHQVN